MEAPTAGATRAGVSIPWRLWAWCALAIVILAALLLQFHTFINHDVAWVLWGTQQMLHGAQFGRDIIEPNPPLAWYISMPPVWVASQLQWPVAGTFRIYVALLALGSLGACHLLMRRHMRELDAPGAWLLTLLTAAYLFLFCHRDFGQREHLTQILALPYLAAAAARMNGARLSVLAATMVGASAGLGFALKPYLLAIPAFVELAGILRGKRLGFVIRPEPIAIAVVIAAYLAAILVFARDYLLNVVPLVQQVYWSFNNPPSLVFGIVLLPAAGSLLLWLILPRLGFPALPTVLAAAALGFLASYLMQMKGYTYHALPYVTTTALALAALALALLRSAKPVAGAIVGTTLLLLCASSTGDTSRWWQYSRTTGGPYAELTYELINAINDHGPGGHFLAVSTHPYPGFPVALEVGAVWSSRTNSQWFLPAVVQLREGLRDADAATLAFAERQARAFILHDLESQPGLVLIDSSAPRHAIGNSNFDFLSFYLEDPEFRARWRPYKETRRIGRFRVFLRAESDQR